MGERGGMEGSGVNSKGRAPRACLMFLGTFFLFMLPFQTLKTVGQVFRSSVNWANSDCALLLVQSSGALAGGDSLLIYSR